VDKSGRRVPGLDLLTEDNFDLPGVFAFKDRDDFGIDFCEELFGEGADVVQVKLNDVWLGRLRGCSTNGSNELKARKFRCKRHDNC